MDNLVVLDCEVYPNYFLIAFKNLDNEKVLKFDIRGLTQSFTDDQIAKVRKVMSRRKTFGFNSNNYDMPIIMYALNGATASQLFGMSEDIISNNLKGWQTIKKYNLVIPEQFFHFDIQEPAPGVAISLKLYGARIHSQNLQDLPIEVGTHLSEEQMEQIADYCINDLNTTIDLYNAIEKRMQLRVDMSETYGRQVLSKSDAQIAEVVIKSELSRTTNARLKAPTLPDDTTFKYEVPKFITFKTQQLQDTLELIRNHDFELDKKGSIKLPRELSNRKIVIGTTNYKMGIGGLHSQESAQTVTPNTDEYLIDKDVASYYPAIILNLGLYPRHLGSRFLDVYRKIVDDRLKAKREGNKVINESLKIVINGSFGKLGNKYSALYSPDLLLTVTLTGQLSLLMLIEELDLQGINVVSANTDGFVSIVPKHKEDIYEKLCSNWQQKTGFVLEDTSYQGLYSRDVNNYLAITDSYSKGKGIFTIDDIMKNPHANICIDAIKAFITEGIKIESTIHSCEDVTRFLIVRSVTGGATWRDMYLGRVVRWIWAKDGTPIYYKKASKHGTHNKVAKSDGAMPIMALSTVPENIDYNRYIQECYTILDDIGYTDL